MTCVLVVDVCKRADEERDFAIDWRGETFRNYVPGNEYAANDHVRPTVLGLDPDTGLVVATDMVATGFEYVADGNGQSNNNKAIKWPLTLGNTVVDGSLVWTAAAISTAGLLRTISASTWTPSDVAVTITDSAIVNSAGSQVATVNISGGTAGTQVEVVNHVTFSDGVELDAVLRITIDEDIE